MNKQGAIDWAILISVPIGIIIMIALFPVIDYFTQEYFSRLGNPLFADLIKLLIGIIPLIIVIKLLMSTIRATTEAPGF